MSLTVVIDGKAHTMTNNHPAWEQAKQALVNEEFDRLEKLFDVGSAVPDYSDGNITVVDGVVKYSGESVNNHVVERLLSFMRNDLPYKPLVRFLDKLMDNPSSRAIEELYSFLEHKNMPLTPDGNFLAYKGVKEDFTDHYSGKFNNSVGEVLEMRRNTVCDDANVGCSHGFHAGSYEYAKGYASGGGHLMIVEINPADVVSVPHDCDCQKLRTSKYKVVSLHETIERPLDSELVDEYYDDIDDEDYDKGWKEGYEAARDELMGGQFSQN